MNQRINDFTKTRELIFKFFNKKIREGSDRDIALNLSLNWLKNLKRKFSLSNNAYKGLKTELHFFYYYEEEMKLTPAGDFGDHCDFTGCDKKNRIKRIDVTSNIDTKFGIIEDIIPYTSKHEYIIAEMRKNDSEPVFYPVPGMRCEEPDCEGKLFDIVVLDPPSSMYRDYSENQDVIRVCNNNWEDHSIIISSGNWNIPTSELIKSYAYEDVVEPPKKEVIEFI